MKILSLNIRHGGGSRVDAIIEYLASEAFDVLVLSEFRNNKSGDKIKQFLLSNGFKFVLPETNEAKKNTVLVAAKSFTKINLPSLPVPWSCIGIKSALINIIGVYFPFKNKKKPLFDWFIETAQSMENTIIIGDFNTGSNELDLEGSSKFYCAKEFLVLSQEKLVDAFRLLHPADREYSWFSSVGNGFRIDHALVTQDLSNQLLSVRYNHDTRISLSDHSAIEISLEQN